MLINWIKKKRAPWSTEHSSSSSIALNPLSHRGCLGREGTSGPSSSISSLYRWECGLRGWQWGAPGPARGDSAPQSFPAISATCPMAEPQESNTHGSYFQRQFDRKMASPLPSLPHPILPCPAWPQPQPFRGWGARPPAPVSLLPHFPKDMTERGNKVLSGVYPSE